jgi:hypothetical protein
MGRLRAAGFMTLGCVGPVRTFACPLLDRRRCPLREAVDLIGVDPASDPAGVCGGWRR